MEQGGAAPRRGLWVPGRGTPAERLAPRPHPRPAHRRDTARRSGRQDVLARPGPRWVTRLGFLALFSV